MSDDDLQLHAEDARVDAILRSMSIDDLDLRTPPNSVWDGIERAVATADTLLAPVVSLANHRKRQLTMVAAAAALVIVAGLAVVLLDATDNGPVEVASSTLAFVENDPGFVDAGIGASAEATLLDDGDRELIRIDASDLPAPAAGSDLELWLIGFEGDEVGVIQPLGLVADPAAAGTFEIPAEFDRGAYDTVAVDISVEPRDGVKAHSGQSIVRGPLV